MRSYEEIVHRVQSLNPSRVSCHALGVVEDYPVFAVTIASHDTLPTMLIIGGTHGDEPAGVEATVAFLLQQSTAGVASLNFEVIPCLNPHGYVHNTRHNRQDVDLNWAMHRKDVPEIQIVRRFLAARRFVAAIDLHEDWESMGFYLYEMRRAAPLLGGRIVNRVAEICSINTAPLIEGLPAQNGVIHPNPDSETSRRGDGIPLVLYEKHTDHFLTTETPTSLPLAQRVQAHLAALEVLIQEHSS